MYYLEPISMNYAWGSKSLIQNLIGKHDEEVLAELWFGAHPKAPSLVNGTPLNSLIATDRDLWLSPKQQELPYLLKVLAADSPLSIQVHPSKQQAESGFMRENQQNIPLDAPHRNYKDSNHKPELIMALTPFDALCGFQDFAVIANNLQRLGLGAFFSTFEEFNAEPDAKHFQAFYQEILVREYRPELLAALQNLNPEAYHDISDNILCCKMLMQEYPTDTAVISPLILNLIHLKEFQAIFLEAGIPHAYLKGLGIEIMASSDNVLRAGLSPKHMDAEELFAILKWQPYYPAIIEHKHQKDVLLWYKPLVQDFALALFEVTKNLNLPISKQTMIVLCIKGSLTLCDENGTLELNQGMAAIIPAASSLVSIKGNGSGVLALSGE